MRLSNILGLVSGCILSLPLVSSIDIDTTNKDSIIKAVDIVTKNALTYYIGNQPGQIPGICVAPYYWWECGGFMGLLVQRYSITGDDSYNDLISQAILHQIGENEDFTPQNQSLDLGNDDQVFWAFAALDAAELNFPNPPSNQPQWLTLAQSVFNDQTDVWDAKTCHGGMRWQIFVANAGYDYKSVGANGGYFQLSSRLARYTGNDTYAFYAERMWDWIFASPIVEWNADHTAVTIWDGIHIEDCSTATKAQYSYNAGNMLAGAAYMYNYTNGNSTWESRVWSILYGMQDWYFVEPSNTPATATKTATFNGTILCDPIPEFHPDKNNDDFTFKAYTSRWLAVTSQLAPFAATWIRTRLHDSAVGAAAQCTGSATTQQAGTVCGRQWWSTTWDGNYGLGEQMSALSIFQSLLIGQTKPPLSLADGANSHGTGGGGGYGDGRRTLSPIYAGVWHDPALDLIIGVKDNVGAAILTITSVVLAVGGTAWMIREM